MVKKLRYFSGWIKKSRFSNSLGKNFGLNSINGETSL